MEAVMKSRVAIWAGVGFLIAGCWVVYTFVTPPESLGINLRQPVVQAALYLTCPILISGATTLFRGGCFFLINAATYAVFGLVLEGFRLKSKPSVAA